MKSKGLLFIYLLLTACAPPPERTRILWPMPPQEQKLEFLGVYSSEGDFPRSKTERFLDAISAERSSVFEAPFGIIADDTGKVYIADRLGKDIWTFDIPKRTAAPFASANFGRPLGLALDQEGKIYVADAEEKKIHVFSAGSHLLSFGTESTLHRPAYIAVHDRLGRIYVSDGKKHRVAVFDKEGHHLFFIGGPGAGQSEFASPQGLAFDRDGRLFVADMLNARIQVFDADGNFIHTFGRQGADFWDFENPKDLAFDSDGNLYILDHRKALLLTYTPEGEFLYATGSSKKTRHPLGFTAPASIFIDSNDRIYITDQMNKRFTIWQYLSPTYLKEHPVTDKDRERLRQLAE